MKYEDDIHNATNERLAEILEANAEFEAKVCFSNGNNLPEFNKDILPPEQWQEAIREAAARLRTKHKEHFNSEAFE